MARFMRLIMGLALVVLLAAVVIAEDVKPAADAAPADAAKPAESKGEESPGHGQSAHQEGPKKGFMSDEDRAKYAKMNPEERKAEREARKTERDAARGQKMEERRAHMEKKLADKKGGKFDKMEEQKGKWADHHAEHMDDFKGAAGMFMAMVDPVKPVKISFPLDEETRLKFSAARDGLMKNVRKEQQEQRRTKSDPSASPKEDMKAKSKANLAKTEELIIEAVKSGMTVQEARMGMVIAQFEALPKEDQEAALEKAKKRQEKMPEGSRSKMNERLEQKNNKERKEIDALTTDADKAAYVRRTYRPRFAMA